MRTGASGSSVAGTSRLSLGHYPVIRAEGRRTKVILAPVIRSRPRDISDITSASKVGLGLHGIGQSLVKRWCLALSLPYCSAAAARRPS